MSRVILITGASSGIGFEAAKQLAQQGHTVYGAARRIDRLQSLTQYGVTPVALDVTDGAAAKVVVDQIIAKENRLDVLINNAGYGSYGAVEEVSIDEAKRQFDVNLFGLAQITKLVLPQMRKQHAGTIINTSWMAGKVWTPFGAWYHATKFAVEGFSNAMRLELEPFGIHVVLVEPGAIKTDWGMIAADHLSESSAQGPYAKAAQRTAKNLRRMYSGHFITAPSKIGAVMAKAATAAKPRTHYLTGFGAKPSVFFSRVVPNRVFDAVIKRVM
ncbi:oxidoreductase [Lacticaseibacillus saniviri]